MLKRVGLTIRSEREDVALSLFDQADALDDASLVKRLCQAGAQEDTDKLEMFCQGRLRLTEDTFSLSYEETEISGMEGTQTQLFFCRGERDRVTMTRSGSVGTTLVFERGVRHVCDYQTPIMPFEVCVYTIGLENRLAMSEGEIGGELELDYLVEIRGAQTQRCRMHIEVK